VADNRRPLSSPHLIQDVRSRRILFVCTANICRSPAAEYLARDRFGSDRFVFRSAGFLESGRRPTGELIRALDDLNVDLRPHRSYRVDVASLRVADLILTMEGGHVQRATAMWPDAWNKIVPLREAATMLRAPAVDRSTFDEFLDMVRRQREPADYLGTQWDIADPYGRGLRFHRRSIAEIESLIEAVFTKLR